MDVNELRFLDHVEAPIFVIDTTDEKNLIYVAYNDHACRMSGLTRADVIGKTAKEIYPGRFGEAAYRRHRQTTRSGQKCSYVLNLNLAGVEREIQTTLAPIIDDDGKVTQLVGVSHEVANTRINEMARDGIDVLTGEVERYISMAAHDLRSPMRNVQTLTEMILEDFEDLGDGKIDMIRMLERVATSSISMISELLSVAEAGRAIEDIAEFDVGKLCAVILVSLDPTGLHKVTCGTIHMAADRTAIQIVLRNLIDNAIKHSGQSIVAFSVSAVARAGGLVEILVVDNGVGFPDPTIAFLDSGELRVESGFGLLGIRRLIEERGGSISAEEPKGNHGGVVRFTLPGTLKSLGAMT